MTALPTFILRIHCQDRPGLVYQVTETLSKSGLNIIHNAEYVDQENSRFFMRTEVTGDLVENDLLPSLKDKMPEDAEIDFLPLRKQKLVLLATKEFHCLGDLLLRCAFDEYHAEIKAVISNHPDLEDLVQKFNIPYHYVPHTDLSREDHEHKLSDVIDQYAPDLLILAKYMRVLTPQFVSRYENKILNIHHSFLPAFIGANPYKQAKDRGVKIMGATAHFVNDALDEGPIITQDVLPISHAESTQEMIRAGRDVEKVVLARALRLVLEGRVFIYQNRTIIL